MLSSVCVMDSERERERERERGCAISWGKITWFLVFTSNMCGSYVVCESG